MDGAAAAKLKLPSKKATGKDEDGATKEKPYDELRKGLGSDLRNQIKKAMK